MAIQGYSGSISVAGSAYGSAKAWSLDISPEYVDTTTLGSTGWKESSLGLKSITGSVTAIFDSAADALTDALMSGAVLALILTVGDGTLGNDVYTGNANITSQSITNDVNGIVEVTFSFESNGAWTHA